jgi:O-antigen/teichoic acid export membrane protein
MLRMPPAKNGTSMLRLEPKKRRPISLRLGFNSRPAPSPPINSNTLSRKCQRVWTEEFLILPSPRPGATRPVRLRRTIQKGPMLIHWRFVRNAVANLGRGSAAAVVALLLPPLLVRHMTAASYAIWVLVLQTAAYVSYLDFGLQTAIGRYVAFAKEKGDVDLRDSVFSTAFAGLCGAALISLVCLALAAAGIPEIFPNVPGPLVPQMRWALLIVGFSIAAELPASAWNGVFVGMERYDVPALTVGGARLLSALGVIAAALRGHSLVVMAAAMAVSNLISYVAQYLALRRMAPDVRFHWRMVRRSTAHELYGYCLGLTVFAFSAFLITGLDLILVGRFQFSMVTPYSVSASMTALVAGLLGAVINVILPHSAALHAGQKAEELGKLVITSTRLGLLLLILTGIPTVIYAGPILRLWIGPQYVNGGTPLLVMLIIANNIRLIGFPYSVILIAAGQQKYVMISPLAEGISNLVASVLLGVHFGALGVAAGTLIGSFVSVIAHLFYSMARTRNAIALSRRKFVISGVVYPLLLTSPLTVVAALSLRTINLNPAIVASAWMFSFLGAGLLMRGWRRQGQKTS